jgi:hypothetical protein
MKIRRSPDLETVPMDGWVKLGPGETFCVAIDTPTTPSVEHFRAKMQSARGMVLSAGFTVENNIIMVQLADAFRTTDRKIGGSAFAEKEDYLRAETTGVERRLEGAKAIIRRILGSDEGEAVIQDLAEYRRVRHLCAHRPCWLTGIWNPDAGTLEGASKGRTTGFRLYIADANYIWEVDDKQVEEWAALLNRTAAAGDKVMRSILQIDEYGKPTTDSTIAG